MRSPLLLNLQTPSMGKGGPGGTLATMGNMAGICGACACQLTAGEGKMAHNEVLAEADVADGYILACQAVPLTESVSIIYP